MANPYHDAEGKFCSKGEMQGAIKKLAESGNLDGYFKLRQEYEAIETNRVVVTKEFIGHVASGYSAYTSDDPEEIRSIYLSLQDKLKDTDVQPRTFYRMVENENTPEDIKEDILAKANPELKREIAKRLVTVDSPAMSTDLIALAKGETNQELLDTILETKKLTFEDKYNIAQTYDAGLATLALNHPSAFFGVKELNNEMLDKAEEIKETNPEAFESYMSVMSRYSPIAAHHSFVLDNVDLDKDEYALYRLSDNKKLNVHTSIDVLDKAASEDLSHFNSCAENIARNAMKRYNSAEFRYDGSYNVELPSGSPSFEAIATAKRLHGIPVDKRTNAEERTFTHTQAQIDSYKDNYSELSKTRKALSKRNAPEKTADGFTLKDVEYRLKNAVLYAQARRYVFKYTDAAEYHGLI